MARLYRGEKRETREGSDELMAASFPDGTYTEVPGLCKVATVEEIQTQGWSLNPGRYVGIAAGELEDFVFAERLEELNEELEKLNAEAAALQDHVAEAMRSMLEKS